MIMKKSLILSVVMSSVLQSSVMAASLDCNKIRVPGYTLDIFSEHGITPISYGESELPYKLSRFEYLPTFFSEKRVVDTKEQADFAIQYLRETPVLEIHTEAMRASFSIDPTGMGRPFGLPWKNTHAWLLLISPSEEEIALHGPAYKEKYNGIEYYELYLLGDGGSSASWAKTIGDSEGSRNSSIREATEKFIGKYCKKN